MAASPYYIDPLAERAREISAEAGIDVVGVATDDAGVFAYVRADVADSVVRLLNADYYVRHNDLPARPRPLELVAYGILDDPDANEHDPRL